MLQRRFGHPAPELTTIVFGPGSASCTAGVANRALSFRLGTVVLTGHPSMKPLFAALVPGGNVNPLSAIA